MLKNNLLHKEFKIMVINNSPNSGPEWMNTENFKQELKNIITKVENILKGINSK